MHNSRAGVCVGPKEQMTNFVGHNVAKKFSHRYSFLRGSLFGALIEDGGMNAVIIEG